MTWLPTWASVVRDIGCTAKPVCDLRHIFGVFGRRGVRKIGSTSRTGKYSRPVQGERSLMGRPPSAGRRRRVFSKGWVHFLRNVVGNRGDSYCTGNCQCELCRPDRTEACGRFVFNPTTGHWRSPPRIGTKPPTRSFASCAVQSRSAVLRLLRKAVGDFSYLVVKDLEQCPPLRFQPAWVRVLAPQFWFLHFDRQLFSPRPF
jgi:hypothetical protein